MKYSTEIDTVSIQIDCKSMAEQQEISFMIARAIWEYSKVCIKDNIFTKDRDILFNNNRLGIIRLGMNPILNKFTRQYDTNYYVTVSFAGLKSYIGILDNLSNTCLLATVGILNTFNIDYKFTELDICMDVGTNMQNVLAICTTKLPRTEYHLANHSFYNGDTVYIEKILKDRLTYNSQRAYVYDKSKKEKLLFPITRFELKLQKLFFLNNELDFKTIINALDRYTVMFSESSINKELIINKYNSYSRVSKRDIDRMGLDKYRLKPDIVKIERFINYLKSYKLY
ncbi:hypothetical protein L5F24_08985 [Aliarcobacter butzleri]|uniref:Uncharacterized protein n=1 Tax=Aliarcobacter butzleri TaxID=28197 RepID=A0AAW7PYG4_9BACT|nr:hypothetical protein [Aliarcobacter butzleri]MCG3668133.1 hypothetical protein [Aliarcobacter butzleri]MDN5071070.1 hypothetical protein [Aliarcobacter butzleri]